jgi:hypothetical protein
MFNINQFTFPIILFIHRFFSFLCFLTDNDDLASYNFLSQSHGYFVTKNNTKIIAQRGGMAFLPCTVKLTSPATVSSTLLLLLLSFSTI